MGIRIPTGRRDTVRNLAPTPLDRRLASRWAGIAAVFAAPPEPAWRWYEPVRAEPRSLPWRTLVGPIVEAVVAGVRTLPPAPLDELRRRVAEFFDAMKAETLAHFPPSADDDLLTLNLRETLAEGELNAAQMRLERDQSPATLAAAEAALDRYVPTVLSLRESVRRRLRVARGAAC